jgi:prepilin-type N-terminal cleavage/methylation domain-containing protein
MKELGHRRKGFTLVELLVVVAIVAVLLAMLTPSLAGARYITKHAVCGTNIRQIIVGLNTYATENGAYYPSNGYNSDTGEKMHRTFPSRLYRLKGGAYKYRGDLRPLLEPYLGEGGMRVMMCPFANDVSRPGEQWGTDRYGMTQAKDRIWHYWRGGDAQGILPYQLHFDWTADPHWANIVKTVRMKLDEPLETAPGGVSGNSSGEWRTLVNDFHGRDGGLHTPPGADAYWNGAHFSLPGHWQGHQYYDTDQMGLNYGAEDGSVLSLPKLDWFNRDPRLERVNGNASLWLPLDHKM